MVYHSNDIVVVNFPAGVGNVQGNRRPALVVQNDIGNRHSDTTIVIPLTTAAKRLDIPTHVMFSCKKYTFLSTNSEALCEQITTVSREMVEFKLGKIDAVDRKKIDYSIKFAMGM